MLSGHRRAQELLRTPGSMPSAWLAEVARLLPELREVFPDLPPPAVLPPEEERRRVFEALVQVVLSLDAHPLLIFVDDLHCADRATLEWLPYLVHRMRSRSLLLVLAYRSGEAPSALIHLVATWGREGVLRRLPLDRLGPDEIAQLIGSLRVDSTLAHRLQAQSAGNPYFLIELSRYAGSAAPDAIPPALADLVRSRIERLGEPAREVLQAAAILEPDFGLPLLALTASHGEDEILDALDTLLRSGALAEARAAYATALDSAERAGDPATAARACLGMGDTYLLTSWADEVVQWAERSFQYLAVESDHAEHAHAALSSGCWPGAGGRR